MRAHHPICESRPVMFSIRSIVVMAFVAAVATVSAAPAASPVEAMAALPSNIEDYYRCTTASNAKACYNLCGGDNGGHYAKYWFDSPDCCCRR
ncbi:unnamed protein product [Mortierella alpina]